MCVLAVRDTFPTDAEIDTEVRRIKAEAEAQEEKIKKAVRDQLGEGDRPGEVIKVVLAGDPHVEGRFELLHHRVESTWEQLHHKGWPRFKEAVANGRHLYYFPEMSRWIINQRFAPESEEADAFVCAPGGVLPVGQVDWYLPNAGLEFVVTANVSLESVIPDVY